MLLPFLYHKLYRVKRWVGDSSTGEHASYEPTDSLDEAHIVSSELANGQISYLEELGIYKDPRKFHRPILDIDIPAQLVQSSTPGKHHLYLDTTIPWDVYVKLLDVMQEAGILEPGYVSASKERGFTAVRLPWIRK